jgi:hypothetical protein
VDGMQYTTSADDAYAPSSIQLANIDTVMPCQLNPFALSPQIFRTTHLDTILLTVIVVVSVEVPCVSAV